MNDISKHKVYFEKLKKAWCSYCYISYTASLQAWNILPASLHLVDTCS